MKTCLIVTGPNTLPADVRDISVSLGEIEIPTIVVDVAQRKPFQMPDDNELGGFIIMGQPRISVEGLRDMFPEHPIVVIEYVEPGEQVAEVTYVCNWHDAACAIEAQLAENEKAMTGLFLDGLALVDEIHSMEADKEGGRFLELTVADLIPLDEREQANAA